jgi:hypothetical protein
VRKFSPGKRDRKTTLFQTALWSLRAYNSPRHCSIYCPAFTLAFDGSYSPDFQQPVNSMHDKERTQAEDAPEGVLLTTTLTEQEIQHNIRAVAHAIAQQEVDGFKVPPSVVVDLHRAARGKITTDDIIRNIYRRFKGNTSKLIALSQGLFHNR